MLQILRHSVQYTKCNNLSIVQLIVAAVVTNLDSFRPKSNFFYQQFFSKSAYFNNNHGIIIWCKINTIEQRFEK